jgi:DMSO reductase anchor subunit
MSTLSSPTASQVTVTESSQMTQSNQTSSSASTSNTSAGYDFTQLLLPAALVAVVLGIIGIFIVRARKRRPKTIPAHVGYCGQCGAELLRNAKFCGKCGAKQS